MREIDQELKRLDKWEGAAAGERAVLLSARAVLAGGTGAHRGRVSQADVASYLAEHPGFWPAQIADALQTSTTTCPTTWLCLLDWSCGTTARWRAWRLTSARSSRSSDLAGRASVHS